MMFIPTSIAGVVEVRTAPVADARGDFARGFCTDEFRDAGIAFDVVQTNISRNHHRGTLRGMHYQADPAPDPKLIRCIRGCVFDVAVDLRPGSDSFCQWVGTELDTDAQNALFVPPGCAHGFLTLEDDSTVEYLMGAAYVPELARGVRWDDPAFAIAWPSAPRIMSERDGAYPDFAAGA
ncbi:MAG: dTDP-4-dehydrorhamnose 3,5-epimerase [Rhodospirillaceae bacterium]|nr:dTDP-4-dehydrorhamnose 3,5-epimerase [Rhodospirillaceae bacterium]